MESNIFAAVKERRLNLKEVAENYGLEANRGGFISCLFHADKTPSMKLYDDHYHCFGCGCHGDVIALTAELFNLTPIQSAQKLASDYGISVDERSRDKKPTIKEKITYFSLAAQETRAYRLLADYCDYLNECRRDYAPAKPGEELHPLFVRAIDEIGKFEYYRDIFITGTKDERIKFIVESAGLLGEIERGVKKARACQAEMA